MIIKNAFMVNIKSMNELPLFERWLATRPLCRDYQRYRTCLSTLSELSSSTTSAGTARCLCKVWLLQLAVN